MKITLKLDGRAASGGTALVMHNERLADPLDSFTQSIKEISGKKKKTDDDHLEMSRLEFLGGLYTEVPIEYPLNGIKPAVGLPAWNILRCLQDGGKRHKLGADVPRGIHPLQDFATLEFKGPKHADALWKDGGFSLRKGAVISGRRIMRTRPMFTEWRAELPIEVDATIFNIKDLEKIWKDAGVYAGLGEMRPIYGRFAATLKKG